MKNLIADFYQSIEKNLLPPVPGNLVLEVSETMEAVWSQVDHLHLNAAPLPSKQTFGDAKDKILVTGASGFIGRHVINKLVQEGYYVQAFVRKLSFTKELERLGVEIHFGDIRDMRTFRQATKGIHCIIHLAAGTHGGQEDLYDITVTGVKNLIELAAENGVKKVVYLSSMSVYEVNSIKPRAILDEKQELERKMEARGAYSCSKGEAEKLVLKAMGKNNVAWKILRPAMIIGKGSDPFLPPLGVSLSKRLNVIFGSGREKLRLVHIDDAVEAILLLIREKTNDNKIYNLIPPEMISKKEYIELIIKNLHPNSKSLYAPHFMIKLGIIVSGALLRLMGKAPFLTLYRYKASQRNVVFDGSLISRELGWHLRKGLRERLVETFI